MTHKEETRGRKPVDIKKKKQSISASLSIEDKELIESEYQSITNCLKIQADLIRIKRSKLDHHDT